MSSLKSIQKMSDLEYSDAITPEIDEALRYIQRSIVEPLSLEQIAKHVGYSPYHFLRLFKKQMGLTPYYYVSSLRLQKAKQLLLETNLSVRDIALEIGQQSVGTFTTRFVEKVGVTPAHFREEKQRVENRIDQLKRLTIGAYDPECEFSSKMTVDGAVIFGNVQSTEPFDGIVFIGLFHKPIPDSLPLYGTLRMSEGNFCFAAVKPGTYYLMATAISWEMSSTEILLPQTTLRTRHHSPINVRNSVDMIHTEAALFPPRIDDPPILISLPLLMNRYMARVLHIKEMRE